MLGALGDVDDPAAGEGDERTPDRALVLMMSTRRSLPQIADHLQVPVPVARRCMHATYAALCEQPQKCRAERAGAWVARLNGRLIPISCIEIRVKVQRSDEREDPVQVGLSTTSPKMIVSGVRRRPPGRRTHRACDRTTILGPETRSAWRSFAPSGSPVPERGRIRPCPDSRRMGGPDIT